MALDELLLTRGQPVIRTYTWAEPAITFGYPMRWKTVADLAGSRPAIRRLTGGGIVEHGDDLTITIVISRDRFPDARNAYGDIHTRIAAGLQTLIPEIRLTTPTDEADSCRCFESPVEFDLMLGNRKILGGAQRRSRNAILYQGSLQLQDRLPGLASAIVAALDPQATQVPLDPSLLAQAQELAATRYATASWNQRR